jgi:hypothetical protein
MAKLTLKVLAFSVFVFMLPASRFRQIAEQSV